MGSTAEATTAGPPSTEAPTTEAATTEPPTTEAITSLPVPTIAGGLPLSESCANANDGFALRYPQGWTTEHENVQWTCSLFDPKPFVLEPDTETPPTAVIAYELDTPFAETYRQLSDPAQVRVMSTEGRVVAGRPAAALEVRQNSDTGAVPIGTTRYFILVDRFTRTFVIETNNDGVPADYGTNRGVVDAMSETLNLAPKA